MITLLINHFIKNPQDIESPGVRAQYGTVCGIAGIILNLFLFVIKLSVGLISGFISIVADAFNNLSDAGSSIITMAGLRIAGHEADADHPFGHGRSEYISGIIIALIIILVGAELIKSSLSKIFHPEDPIFSIYLVIALLISIAVKFYMFVYNKALAKKLDAPAFLATAQDSISDVYTTSAVLVATLIYSFLGLNLDGYFGVAVGIMIIKGGVDVFKETSDRILGQGTDPDFKDKIYKIVRSYPEVLGVHDLMVHDYGPGRRIISLHAEVDYKGDILTLHDTIDNIEKELQHRLNSQAVIHMDPIVTDDEEINHLREMVIDFTKELGEDVSIHDFRVVKGPTHTNIIFDVLLPFENKRSVPQVKRFFREKIREVDKDYYVVITVDRPS